MSDCKSKLNTLYPSFFKRYCLIFSASAFLIFLYHSNANSVSIKHIALNNKKYTNNSTTYVKLKAGIPTPIGEIITQIREQTSIPVHLDARLSMIPVYISADKADAHELLIMLEHYLGVHERKVGNQIFLARTVIPLRQLSQRQRDDLALATKPGILQHLINLRKDARKRLTVLSFSNKIPVPESWFIQGKIIPYSKLNKEQKNWLLQIAHTYPGHNDAYDSIDLDNCKAEFGDKLWVETFVEPSTFYIDGID